MITSRRGQVAGRPISFWTARPATVATPAGRRGARPWRARRRVGDRIGFGNSARVAPPIPAAPWVIRDGINLRIEHDDAVCVGPLIIRHPTVDGVADLVRTLQATVKDNVHRAPR